MSQAGLSRAMADGISGSIEKYADLLADVTAENIVLQVGLDFLNDAKELAKARLDEMREQYRQSQAERFETLVRINRLRAIEGTLSLESAGLIEDISRTENLLKDWKVVLAQFERRRDTLKDSYGVMAERVKEARLQATAAPEDVRIAARAVVPDRKTGPHRSMIVLASLIFIFLFFVLAAMVWEFVVRRPENA
jgi:uncharacterized protein involved in exopolysaccharide biosynthesis